MEHTPDPQPTVYEGIPFIWGFGDPWGMLQGYVGVLLKYNYSVVPSPMDEISRVFVAAQLYATLPSPTKKNKKKTLNNP